MKKVFNTCLIGILAIQFVSISSATNSLSVQDDFRSERPSLIDEKTYREHLVQINYHARWTKKEDMALVRLANTG